MNNYKKLYTVSGMTCDGCVQTIGNKLNLESEISEVNIDLNSSEMSITADKEFSINELNKIIENVGDYKINEYKNKNIFVKILSLFNTYKPILVSLSIVITDSSEDDHATFILSIRLLFLSNPLA